MSEFFGIEADAIEDLGFLFRIQYTNYEKKICNLRVSEVEYIKNKDKHSEPTFIDHSTIRLKTDNDRLTIDVCSFKESDLYPPFLDAEEQREWRQDLPYITTDWEILRNHEFRIMLVQEMPELLKKYGIDKLRLECCRDTCQLRSHVIEVFAGGKINLHYLDIYLRKWVTFSIVCDDI